MKKVLFLMTHLGSNWEDVKVKLETDKRFHVFQTNLTYQHPSDLSQLISLPHRCDNRSAVWVDVILHNKDFTLKRLCCYYRFLFWHKPFADISPEWLKSYGEGAYMYWNYRTAGLQQYYKRCNKALWNPKLLENDLLFLAGLG